VGINFKARQSIGKVAAPVAPPATVDYKLWSAPRTEMPVNRKNSTMTGTGSGPMATETSATKGRTSWTWLAGRWAIRLNLPTRVMSFGSRWGYDDDGQTANNQMAYYDYAGGTPLLFDNRGLPMKDMNWAKGF
jgi:hypothetical protein